MQRRCLPLCRDKRERRGWWLAELAAGLRALPVRRKAAGKRLCGPAPGPDDLAETLQVFGKKLQLLPKKLKLLREKLQQKLELLWQKPKPFSFLLQLF